MAHQPAREGEIRVGGLRLWARFTLFMTGALAIVMAGAGFFLFTTSSRVARSSQEQALLGSLQATAEAERRQMDIDRLQSERELLTGLEKRIPADGASPELASLRDELRALRQEREGKLRDLSQSPYWKQVGLVATSLGKNLMRTTIEYGEDRRPGVLYQLKEPGEGGKSFHLILPGDIGTQSDTGLLGLIVGATILVILVAAGVSVWVANTVSGPLEDIVHDIRQISTGDLNHRTRVKGGGELELLARSIDRMTKNLSEARETELELQIREREVEVASEVREALLPQGTPAVPGYDLGAMHLSSQELWGDFHDFIELEDESARVGLLVCEVSGKGVPGALVGATARSYLRATLARGGDVREALQAVNRDVARDVRRGMFATALYVLVDPARGVASVACAGHKIPLVRFTAADGKLRLIQPEGIALGFDKGPIFDRALQVQQVPLEPGDRLVLANSGAVSVADPQGKELGEKPLYAQVLRHARLPSAEFLARLKAALEAHAAATPLSRDVSIATIARR